jgi:IstB-like ATP binding protein
MGTLLGNEVLATALLDRLMHHAEVLAIDGRSYRMKERQLPPSLPPVVPAVAVTGGGSITGTDASGEYRGKEA